MFSLLEEKRAPKVLYYRKIQELMTNHYGKKVEQTHNLVHR